MCGFTFFFFFKQKTAYELRISDWSSDVCSSDLPVARRHAVESGIHHDRVEAGRLGDLLGRRGHHLRQRLADNLLRLPDAGGPTRLVAAAGKPGVERSDGKIHGKQDRKSTRLNSSH